MWFGAALIGGRAGEELELTLGPPQCVLGPLHVTHVSLPNATASPLPIPAGPLLAPQPFHVPERAGHQGESRLQPPPLPTHSSLVCLLL